MVLFGFWGFGIVVLICARLFFTVTHIYSVSKLGQKGYCLLQILKKPASSLASTDPFLPIIVVSSHV